MAGHIDFHPLADLFPLIEGAEFDELVADVKAAHGVREPIVLFDGKILDGRNRYRAALAAGVEFPTRTYDGDDPLAYVISANLRRRHLTESQRAMVAARLASMAQGARTDLSPIGERLSQGQAAEMLNVGKRSVERAVQVRDHGTSELQRAVERGGVSVSAAADVASLPQEQQAEIVAHGERDILEKAKAIRAKKFEATYNKKVARLREVSGGNTPLSLKRQYPVILSDPAWKFHAYESSGKFMGVPEDHYPTMELADICKLPVSDLATPDAALFLWTPNSILPEALQVMAAWGFEYATNVAWVKDKSGLGFWVRNKHELLILARRGDMPVAPPSKRSISVIQAPRREHSQKPDEAYELIERMYPDLPKLEMFARKARPGWDCWGNEAPMVEAAE